MVCEAVQGDGKQGVGKALKDIAGFEYGHAVSVWSKPPRSHVVHTIREDERIVVYLGHFVAEPGNIRGNEKLSDRIWRNPTREVEDPALFRIGAWLKHVGMETQDAAIRNVSEVHERIREQN